MQNNNKHHMVCFRPQIIVPINVKQKAEEQKSVDEGHSPWKLDPVFVSQVFASLLIFPEGITGDYPISYSDIELIMNSGTDAIADIHNGITIAKKVYLKKLFRKDDTGIWSVIGYDLLQRRYNCD